MTPGLSSVDHEVGLRHGLPVVEVFNADGSCTDLISHLKVISVTHSPLVLSVLTK